MRDFNYKLEQGFTIIELMMVLTILVILTTIAVPSYRSFIIQSTESEVQAKMQSLQLELESWHSSALTFKGFIPQKVEKDGTVKFTYDDSNQKIIYVPSGADSSNYKYKITLDDGFGSSLSGSVDLKNITVGSSWRMYAEPNEGIRSGANKFWLRSDGSRCKSQAILSQANLDTVCNSTNKDIKPW